MTQEAFYLQVDAENAPEVEIDSITDEEFGTLYRVFYGSSLIGTYYQTIEGSWIPQPCNNDLRPRCDTDTQALLIILGYGGCLVVDSGDED